MMSTMAHATKRIAFRDIAYAAILSALGAALMRLQRRRPRGLGADPDAERSSTSAVCCPTGSSCRCS